VHTRAFQDLPQIVASVSDAALYSVRPLQSLFRWLFGSRTDRAETLEDRLSRVSRLRLTPARFVAYEGEKLIFSATGYNAADQTIHGLVFTWESGDSSKVSIDEKGQASFLQAGLTTLICRAGSVAATARVQVRPGRRPRQTDNEWRLEQESLQETATGIGALLDKLMPTAYAQGGYAGTDFGFDEMWSEPRNLTGNPAHRAIESTAIGSVLPEGSNFNFSVPFLSLSGRGLSASLSLYYNSRVWGRRGNYVTFSPAAGFPFAGFSMGFGRILTYGTSSNTKYVLIDADGTRHYLGAGDGTMLGTYQTTDGTHITYVGAATGGTLYYNNGTKISYGLMNNRLLPLTITDTNGNYTQISYNSSAGSPLALSEITDTKGRKIQFQYDISGKLISITAPGYGGTSQNPVTRTVVQFDYETRTVSYNFNGLTVENAPTGSVQVLKHIYFPTLNTGYLFTYSDYGMITTVSKRRAMSINGSGVISDGTESASASFNYPTTGTTQLSDAPAFTQRTESPGGTYTYSSSTNALAQTMTFTVARPDSSNLLLTRSTNTSSTANGLLTQSEITKNSISYAKTVTAYTTDAGSNVQVQNAVAYNDAGTPTKVDIDYDQYGNVTNRREYGFQISGAWQVRRRTAFTYKTESAYTNIYLRSLALTQQTYDALENTSDGDDVLIAKQSWTYDDYNATGGMEGYGTAKPPNWDSSYTTSYTIRGNVTGETVWTDIANNLSITKLKKYDKFGNAIQYQASCCTEKAYTYNSTHYWAQAETVTDGDPAGMHLDDTFNFDFNTSLQKWYETPTQGKTTYYYDGANRLTQMTRPDGYSETRTYNDATMSVTITRSNLGTTTTTDDGWGRVVSFVDVNNGQVNTVYDAIGRVQSRTYPFQAGGTPGPALAYQYDALSRVTVVTFPDNNTVQTTYSGNTETITDQVNRKTKRESDGLGRLTKVTEQDAVGDFKDDTTYTYNLLDELTQVNQGNQLRSFKYDAAGRLLYEKIPEQTATINDGTGTLWTTKYVYTDFDAVQTRTDARGVITTYTYDDLNRLTGVSYNTSNAPGVATTGSVAYTYDINQSSSTNGLLLSAGSESFGYNGDKRLTSVTRSIDGTNYTTNYSSNSAGARTQIIYPSTRQVNLNRDSAGRLTSLTDAAAANYVSSITYSVAGYRNGWTLGNGVVETFTHDTNRGFLASQSATKTGNTLLSLNYSYQAAAGQSGAGTTAGNGHQMISISGTIGGLTESASYTYDLQKRLLTSNQTTNSTSAQRRFAYDRWGNRTTTHDAVSGGTQIQTITLQQSGGIPSNRISSVNNGGSFNYNYSYDNAGNVTNDGLHTYIYDAENRLVSVDNGTTAQYGYNYKNQRIKKTGAGGSITRYVWENDKVIAEYNGSTGALIAEHIFYEDVPICKEQGGRVYFLSDKLSIRAILDANGNIIGRQAHLPFGDEIGGSGTQDKRHLTSYEADSESNTDYAWNRHYAQSVGRFMSADPYESSAGGVNPQSWNRYSYVLNDPIHNHDPKGLFLEGPRYEYPCDAFDPPIIIPPRGQQPPPLRDCTITDGGGQMFAESDICEKENTFRAKFKIQDVPAKNPTIAVPTGGDLEANDFIELISTKVLSKTQRGSTLIVDVEITFRIKKEGLGKDIKLSVIMGATCENENQVAATHEGTVRCKRTLK